MSAAKLGGQLFGILRGLLRSAPLGSALRGWVRSPIALLKPGRRRRQTPGARPGRVAFHCHVFANNPTRTANYGIQRTFKSSTSSPKILKPLCPRLCRSLCIIEEHCPDSKAFRRSPYLHQYHPCLRVGQVIFVPPRKEGVHNLVR